jgi:hypothetical protein
VVQTPHPPINKLIRKKWKLSWLGYFLIVAGFVVFSFMGFGMRKIVLLCSFFFCCLYDPKACLVAGEGRTRGCKQEPPLPPKLKMVPEV